MCLLQAGANHNVIAYNSMEPTLYDSASDLSLHGNWAHHNLFEGNQFLKVQHDGDHGVNGPLNTFFPQPGWIDQHRLPGDRPKQYDRQSDLVADFCERQQRQLHGRQIA